MYACTSCVIFGLVNKHRENFYKLLLLKNIYTFFYILIF